MVFPLRSAHAPEVDANFFQEHWNHWSQETHDATKAYLIGLNKPANDREYMVSGDGYVRWCYDQYPYEPELTSNDGFAPTSQKVEDYLPCSAEEFVLYKDYWNVSVIERATLFFDGMDDIVFQQLNPAIRKIGEVLKSGIAALKVRRRNEYREDGGHIVIYNNDDPESDANQSEEEQISSEDEDAGSQPSVDQSDSQGLIAQPDVAASAEMSENEAPDAVLAESGVVSEDDETSEQDAGAKASEQQVRGSKKVPDASPLSDKEAADQNKPDNQRNDEDILEEEDDEENGDSVEDDSDNGQAGPSTSAYAPQAPTYTAPGTQGRSLLGYTGLHYLELSYNELSTVRIRYDLMEVPSLRRANVTNLNARPRNRIRITDREHNRLKAYRTANNLPHTEARHGQDFYDHLAGDCSKKEDTMAKTIAKKTGVAYAQALAQVQGP